MTWNQKGSALRVTTTINNVAAKRYEMDVCYAGGPPTALIDWRYTVIEELADLLNPGNEAFQKLLKRCRCGIPEGITKTMGREPKLL